MADDTPSQEAGAETAAPSPPPRTSGFRKKFTENRLAPESAARQGKIARIAFEALGREGATAFLNGHDDALGGRPLDLAIASDAGLAAVEQAITTRRGAQ